jgi:hypothetical protein
MFTWHRVFGSLEQETAPADLCEELVRHGFTVRPSFRGDDDGWFAARLELDEGASSVHIERYLVRQEKLRGELNNWCAWVETLPATQQQSAVFDALVATTQFFTIYEDAEHDPEAASSACSILCRWLARRIQGVYQIDGQGVYDQWGTLLVAEPAGRAHA